MKKQITGLLVDPFNKTIIEINFNNDLKAYQQIIGCDTVWISSFYIDDNSYTFIYDDEGKYQLNNLLFPPAVILQHKGKTHDYLVGKVIICRHDGEGNETSLTDEDINYLMERKYVFTNKEGGNKRALGFIATYYKGE